MLQFIGAYIDAYITPVNKDIPLAAYGTDTPFYDVVGKITTSYLATYKNDTNSGYHGMEADMKATMSSGWENKDEVYLITGMGAFNESMRTVYEYDWRAR